MSGWQLPPNLQREQAQLERAGIHCWSALARLTDAELRRLASQGDASEGRLIRLRGQAQLVVDLDLEPAQAALLLHAGIASRAALAASDPHRMLVQMGRLQRSLTGAAAPLIDLCTLQRWIQRARRPTN